MTKKILVSAELLALGWLAVVEDLRLIGFAVLSVLGVTGLIALISMSWPIGALFTLVGASAIPRVVWTIGGIHAHPEHLAIGAMVLVILCRAPQTLRRSLNLHAFDYFLLGYIALNFFSSAFASPEPNRTLRWAALQVFVIAPYFLIRVLVTDRTILWRVWRFLLLIGALESVYGCIALLSNRAFGSRFGVEAEQYGSIPGTYGTQYEANLFGSYTACAGIMCLAAFLLSRDSDRKWYLRGFIVSALAMSMSLSRAVLLSFCVSIPFVLWITARRQNFEIRRLARIAVFAVVALLAAGPVLVPMVRERFENVDFTDVTSDETVVERLIQTKVAIDNIAAHPVFGSGAASFQLFFNWQEYIPEMGDIAGWLGNTPLRILHDTGIAGLTVFLAFLSSLGWAGWKARGVMDPQTRIVLWALACGVVLYAMTFQSTEATTLAFTWVHLGLLANGIILAKRDRVTNLRTSEIR